MSLPALATMICAARALRGLTEGWAVVRMAPRDAIEDALEGGRVVIAVQAGDEIARIDGRQWTRADRTVELAVQVFLPARLSIEIEGVRREFDTGTAGGEVVFSTVHRMIERAFSAPGDLWCDLLQSHVLGHPEEVARRPFIAELEKGAKVAAVDFSIPCTVDDSPPIGEAPSGFWADLIEAMAADDGLADVAPYLAALIEGEALPAWRVLQALAGLTRDGLQAVGLGPLPQGGGDEISPLSQASIDGPHRAVTL